MNLGIGLWRTGIFNVADVAIMVGACLFVVMEIGRPTGSNPGVPRRGLRLKQAVSGADEQRLACEFRISKGGSPYGVTVTVTSSSVVAGPSSARPRRT